MHVLFTNLAMEQNRITDLAPGVDPNDAATVSQLPTPPTVQEEDGTPSATPTLIKFPNSTLTVNLDGSVSVSTQKIGVAVSGGTATRVLYVDASGNLAQNSNFNFNPTNNRLTLADTSATAGLQVGNFLLSQSLYSSTPVLNLDGPMQMQNASEASLFLVRTGGSTLRMEGGSTQAYVKTMTNHGISFGTNGVNDQVQLNTTGQMLFGATGAGSPPISFIASPNMGFYRINATNLGMSIGGVLMGKLDNSSFTVGDGTTTGDRALEIRAPAGSNRSLFFRTGTLLRWNFAVNNTAEGGSNAGSDIALFRYNDAGTSLGAVFSIVRSTGALTYSNDAVFSGAFRIGAATTNTAAARFHVSYTDTVTSASNSLVNLQYLLNPGGASTATHYGLNVQNGTSNANANNITGTIIGTHNAIVHRGTGVLSATIAENISAPSLSSTGTITDNRGLHIENQGNALIGTSYALRIASQSGSSTATFGMYFVGSGNVANGITWGGQSNLYQSATNRLRMDQALSIGTFLAIGKASASMPLDVEYAGAVDQIAYFKQTNTASNIIVQTDRANNVRRNNYTFSTSGVTDWVMGQIYNGGGASSDFWIGTTQDASTAVGWSLTNGGIARWWTGTVRTELNAGVLRTTTNHALTLGSNSSNYLVLGTNGQVVAQQSGSESLPIYTFNGETTTGFYRIGTGAWGFASSGALNFQFLSGTMVLGTNAFASTIGLDIRAAAGQTRRIIWRTAANARWTLNVDNTTESGSNAGSNLALGRYDDAGNLLGNAVVVNRATGMTTLESLKIGTLAGYLFGTTGTVSAVANIPSTDISGLSEAIDDRVAALLVQGSGMSLVYNDAGNTLTISLGAHTHTASEITDFSEAVDDRVVALVQNTATIQKGYDDVANTLSFTWTPPVVPDNHVLAGYPGDGVSSGSSVASWRKLESGDLEVMTSLSAPGTYRYHEITVDSQGLVTQMARVKQTHRIVFASHDFKPLGTGALAKIRVPSIDDQADVAWDYKQLYFRVEGGAAGTSSIRLEYSPDINGALTWTNQHAMAGDLSITAAGPQRATLGAGNFDFGGVAEGGWLRINITAINSAHTDWYIELVLQEM